MVLIKIEVQKLIRLLYPETNALICSDSSVKICQSTELYVPQDVCLQIFSHTKKRSCQRGEKVEI